MDTLPASLSGGPLTDTATQATPTSPQNTSPTPKKSSKRPSPTPTNKDQGWAALATQQTDEASQRTAPTPAANSPGGSATAPARSPTPPAAEQSSQPSRPTPTPRTRSPVPTPEPQASPEPEPAPPPEPEPVPEHSQTLATVIITSTSSRTTPPPPPTSAPSLVPNGSLFTGNKGEADNNPKQGKSAAGTVAGVIGGLSAAILLGVLAFFLWKWKTRGRYRFNKRSSFGPYGNGIDANRGDMLVSSVTCKAADSVSAHGESTYSSDDSPTRYAKPSFDINREPTLPAIPAADRPFPPLPPVKQVSFDLDPRPNQPFPPYPSDPPMGAGVLPRPVLRQGPILYEPRRPPVPPSMRRNRPQPPRGFDGPGAGYGFPPNPDAIQPLPRSNTISSQMPTQPPGSFLGDDRIHRVRRSASLSDAAPPPPPQQQQRYLGPGPPSLDPLSMHPVIPEVPSGANSPLREDAPRLAGPGQMSEDPRASTSITARILAERWSTASTEPPRAEIERPRQLFVTNPSPASPALSESQPSRPSMVQRVASLRQEAAGGDKPQDAAKNF